MRSSVLVTTAIVFALSLTAAQAADKTAPGGTGVVNSAEGKGGTTKDTSTMPGESSKAGSPTGMQREPVSRIACKAKAPPISKE